MAKRFHKLRIAIELGMRSAIWVPLIAFDEITGILFISSVVEDAYSRIDVEKLERVGAQIAGAIANARSHAEILESERARMAAESEKRELELLDEQRSNFMATVSHELKTPLTSLLAFADILARNKESNLTDLQLEQIQVMQRGSRRLDLLIDDLLDVSRLDAGTFTLEKQEFDVKVLIEELSIAFGPQIEANQQTLNVSCSSDEIWLKADRARTSQVISNGLTNASKYSLPGTKIELEVGATMKSLAITVTDAGIGMSDETLDQLFTMFYRSADEHTESQPGSGLGMAIVKSIVELHNGTITIASKLGIGTDVLPQNRSNSRVRVLETEKGEIWHAGSTHLNRSSASCARLRLRLPRGRRYPCGPRYRGHRSDLLSLAQGVRWSHR